MKMVLELHSWWQTMLPVLANDQTGSSENARQVLALAKSDAVPAVSVREVRASKDGYLFGILLDVSVERPQELIGAIKKTEPIAVVFWAEQNHPSIFALRTDFPVTMHQNTVPESWPASICIDDRPWQEAQLTFTAHDLFRRIQLWLSKAASGNLHDPSQPVEPLFLSSPLSLVIPRSALSAGSKPVALDGFRYSENERVIITQVSAEQKEPSALTVLFLRAAPQAMRGLHKAPTTLASLGTELSKSETNLLAFLKERLAQWAGHERANILRLNTNLALVITFSTVDSLGRTTEETRGFFIDGTAGELAVEIGALLLDESDVKVHKNVTAATEKNSHKKYLATIGLKTDSRLPETIIQPANIHVAFDRELGSQISGQSEVDIRKVVLIGAGSLGSQLATNLAREGRFQWCVIDPDILLPHNFARHAISPDYVGVPKSMVLARNLELLLGDKVSFLQEDILSPTKVRQTEIRQQLLSADLIIDASASVAVSRHLSCIANVSARRISIFFNPSGDALVMLTEDTSRETTLLDLEAQYHRMVQTRSSLQRHLRIDGPGLLYSGSCRSVTNRIPGARAAQLSAIAAQAICQVAAQDQSQVDIWTINPDLSVSLESEKGNVTTHQVLGDWSITYGNRVADEIFGLRASILPRETGGILLGIIDTSRKTVQIIQALPESTDSKGSTTSFERGVTGLARAVNSASERSLHQIRYVGEWHSHPIGSSTNPSITDIKQVGWLTSELEAEGLPAIMLIAGDEGKITLILGNGLSSNLDDRQ